jgi:hypothetical protein
MRTFVKKEILNAFVLLASFTCGCGDSRPATVPVQGRITWQGKPLTQGIISFLPKQHSDGFPSRTAIGVIQPDGSYQLSSFRPNDGVIPGDYQVAVDMTGNRSLENTTPAATKLDPATLRYTNPQASGLTATIPAESSPLTIDFVLPVVDRTP